MQEALHSPDILCSYASVSSARGASRKVSSFEVLAEAGTCSSGRPFPTQVSSSALSAPDATSLLVALAVCAALA